MPVRFSSQTTSPFRLLPNVPHPAILMLLLAFCPTRPTCPVVLSAHTPTPAIVSNPWGTSPWPLYAAATFPESKGNDTRPHVTDTQIHYSSDAMLNSSEGSPTALFQSLFNDVPPPRPGPIYLQTKDAKYSQLMWATYEVQKNSKKLCEIKVILLPNEEEA